MRKFSLVILTCLVLSLAACGSSSGPRAVSDTISDTLPIETQLALGTLELEGTEQAVTANQANKLLVMWQVYQDLSSNDTAAQAEIDGLLEQIQETMTAEQMTSISAMNLGQQDVFTLIQERGVGMGQIRQSSGNSSSTQSGGFALADGDMAGGPPPDAGTAGGSPPDGGFGGMDGAGSSLSTGQSQSTGAASGGGSPSGTPTILVDALIQYLDQIASV